MKDMYYNLRNDNHLQLPTVMTTRYGTENIMYRGDLLWSFIPKERKSSSILHEFKEHIKLWNGNICNCRFCKALIPGVGYLCIKNCSIFS